MLRRVVLASGLLVAAPLLVASWTHRLADDWGARAGRALAEWARLLPSSGQSAIAREAPRPHAETPPTAEAPAVTAEVALRSPRSHPKRTLSVPQRAPQVFVSAPAVLALARGGVLPQAVPVAANSVHPAGLRLANAGALGLGMRDGDVLSRVAGAPATSVPAVVEVVLRARAGYAPAISAEFWREGVRWGLVVEQPYTDNATSRSVTP